MSQKMKIVVPVYNSEKWIKDCIDSILNQQFKNYECIVINDCSTDKTGEVIEGLNLDSRFIVRHNKENKGALANIIGGFESLDSKNESDSILITVDGDDKLASFTSLNVVDKVYTKMPKCLLTYGSYIDWPSGFKGICESFPQDVINSRSYRSYPKFITSHLRTFKSKLWNELAANDLIDPRTGEYYKVTGDVAVMMPLLEMAGDNFVFIEQILYLYNKTNPISDGYIREKEQWETNQLIRRLAKKDVLR